MRKRRVALGVGGKRFCAHCCDLEGFDLDLMVRNLLNSRSAFDSRKLNMLATERRPFRQSILKKQKFPFTQGSIYYTTKIRHLSSYKTWSNFCGNSGCSHPLSEIPSLSRIWDPLESTGIPGLPTILQHSDVFQPL